MSPVSRRTIIKAALAGAASAAGLTGCASKRVNDNGEAQLNILSWADYMHPDTIPEFEKRFGIKVVYDTIASNEALLSRMQAGSIEYDVIVPTSYAVAKLKQLHLLDPIDKDRVPNYKNIMQRYRTMSFDPGNEYSIPYTFGTTGIAYNKNSWLSSSGAAPDDWDAFWDKRFAGRMTLLEDARETIGLAMKRKGHSYNSVNAQEIQSALGDLSVQKPLTMCYTSDQVIIYMASGDSHLSLAFSGDAHLARRQNDNVEYVIPRSGASMWVDNMCIPAGAPHKDNALKWLNYILEPATAAAITNYTYYPTPNIAAISMVDSVMLKDKTLYPDERILDRCEEIRDIGDGIFLYDRAWTELKCI